MGKRNLSVKRGRRGEAACQWIRDKGTVRVGQQKDLADEKKKSLLQVRTTKEKE